MDDLKERRGYCNLKKEALDRTVWGGGGGELGLEDAVDLPKDRLRGDDDEILR